MGVRKTFKHYIRLLKKNETGICLINLPRDHKECYIPMGLLALEGFLKATTRSQIIDFDLMHKKNEIDCDNDFFINAVSIIQKTRFKIFGITADCCNYPLAIKLSKRIKATIPTAIIILGGPQASTIPEQTLLAFPYIDVIVIGEGERTLLALLQAIQNKENLSAVKGIVYRNSSQICSTTPRDQISDLNSLPYPTFSSYPTKDYLDLLRSRKELPYIPIEAGRGCPKKCYYCATSRMWQRSNRLKSPDRIYSEMENCHRSYGVNAFELIHDNLAANRRFIKDFCKYLIQIDSPFTWACSASTDRLDKDSLELLKDAGCTHIFFGIESGSPRMQRIMDKHLNLTHADEMIRYCSEIGITVIIGIIFGFPEETEEDLEQTLQRSLLYRRYGAEVRFGQLAPLTGTPIHEKYSTNLALNKNSSCISPRVFEFDDQVSMLVNHPDIFSSFYTVPNKYYPDLDYASATLFFDITMNYYLQPLCNINDAIEKVGDGLLSFYRCWNKWRNREHRQNKLSPELVFYSFNEFLDTYCEIFYERIGKKSA